MGYRTKKKGEKDEPFYIKLITSLAISLILTIVFMFFIFIVIGSITIAESFSTIKLDVSKIMFISITIICYSLIFDHLIFTTIKHLLGKNTSLVIIMSMIRFLVFYTIGSFYLVQTNINLIMTVILVSISLSIDIINIYNEKTNES